MGDKTEEKLFCEYILGIDSYSGLFAIQVNSLRHCWELLFINYMSLTLNLYLYYEIISKIVSDSVAQATQNMRLCWDCCQTKRKVQNNREEENTCDWKRLTISGILFDVFYLIWWEMSADICRESLQLVLSTASQQSDRISHHTLVNAFQTQSQYWSSLQSLRWQLINSIEMTTCHIL